MTEPSKQLNKAIKQELIELISTLAWALVIALLLRTILFQPFHIPTGSMYPQLKIGDYLISSKYAYGYSKHSLPGSLNIFSGRILDSKPKRGDIVVFKWPRDNKTDYIKRLIGMPGDRVQMKDGRLWLNGEKVPVEVLGEEVSTDGRQLVVTKLRETLPNGRSFITWDSGRTELDNTFAEIVPEGHYFMMGDSRDNSLDSRKWGFVPEENLIGRAEVILVSVNEEFRLLKPWTWFNFRNRIFVSLRSDR